MPTTFVGMAHCSSCKARRVVPTTQDEPEPVPTEVPCPVCGSPASYVASPNIQPEAAPQE